MMSSEFYKDRFSRRIPLTGLFMERLGALVSEHGDVTEEVTMVAIVGQAMIDAKLVEEITDEALTEVVTQLNEHRDEKKGDEEGAKPQGQGKHFAGYFSEWASGLSYDKLCFYAAGYDYAKAREYFENHDQRSILALADEKLRLEFELARVSFEAALFGFGGSYKDTPREGDSVFDLSDDSQIAENALKNLGF